jgi:hypothetical protein
MFSGMMDHMAMSAGPLSFLGVVDRVMMGAVSCAFRDKVRDPGLWTRILDDAPCMLWWLFDRCRSIRSGGLQFHHLLSINARCCGLTDATLAVVTLSCRSLTSLDVSGNSEIGGVSFGCIGHLCQELTSLTVSDCTRLNDEAMQCIARGCQKLTSLNVAHCPRLTNASVRVIARSCRKITSLDVSYCPKLTGNSMIYVAWGIASLTSLFVAGCYKISRNSIHTVALACNLLTLIDIGIRFDLGIHHGSFKKTFPKIKVEIRAMSIPFTLDP